MTATIVEKDTVVTEDFKTDEPIPCDKLDPDDVCDRSADYRVQTACCGFTLMLCEECLFSFIEWARMWAGKRFVCIHCMDSFDLSPNHLIVTGRVR